MTGLREGQLVTIHASIVAFCKGEQFAVIQIFDVPGGGPLCVVPVRALWPAVPYEELEARNQEYAKRDSP